MLETLVVPCMFVILCLSVWALMKMTAKRFTHEKIDRKIVSNRHVAERTNKNISPPFYLSEVVNKDRLPSRYRTEGLNKNTFMSLSGPEHFNIHSSFYFNEDVSTRRCTPKDSDELQNHDDLSENSSKQSYRAMFYDLLWDVIDDDSMLSDMADDLERRCKSSWPVIGLDCEWWSNNNVSLMQLATLDGHCYLLRMHRLKSCKNPTLQKLLENPSIYKVGVSVYNDVSKLQCQYGLEIRGCIDLRNLVARSPDRDIEARGLAYLSARLLDVHLDKTPARSYWEAENLNYVQQEYAARDALCGALIFAELVRHRVDLMQLKSIGMDHTRGEWMKVKELCRGLIDKNYEQGRVSDAVSLPQFVPEGLDNSPVVFGKSDETCEVRTNSRTYVRRSKLYDNARLLAPDGQLLCVIDNAKARWYREKGLADRVSDTPLTVKLRFEPSGRPQFEGDHGSFYLQEKLNICVCCGAEYGYVRKNVVPQEYRKHFPELMKSHQSHDVLLLCVECHMRSDSLDAQLKASLAEECQAPFNSRTYSKSREDAGLKKVRSAARALLYSGDELPQDRRFDLWVILWQFYGRDHLTREQLKAAAQLDIQIERTDFVPHGEKVIRFYERRGLINLERKWRQHFLVSMDPQFMPKYWSVDHNHARIRTKILDSYNSIGWKRAVWQQCLGSEYPE